MRLLGISDTDVVVVENGVESRVPLKEITPESDLVSDPESFILGHQCGRDAESRSFRDKNQRELF